MTMKKGLVLVLIICCCFSLFALQNTFGPSSDEYINLMTLCAVSGIRPSIMVLPITSEQMLKVLDSIPVSKLDENSLGIYTSLRAKLERPTVVMDKILGGGLCS